MAGVGGRHSEPFRQRTAFSQNQSPKNSDCIAKSVISEACKEAQSDGLLEYANYEPLIRHTSADQGGCIYYCHPMVRDPPPRMVLRTRNLVLYASPSYYRLALPVCMAQASGDCASLSILMWVWLR